MKTLASILGLALALASAGTARAYITTSPGGGGSGGGPTNGITAADAGAQIKSTNDAYMVYKFNGGSTNQALTNAVLHGTLIGSGVTGISAITTLGAGQISTGGSLAITNTDGGDILFGAGGLPDPDFQVGLEGGDAQLYFNALKGGNFVFKTGSVTTPPLIAASVRDLELTNGATITTNLAVVLTNGTIASATMGSGFSYNAGTRTVSVTSSGGAALPTNGYPGQVLTLDTNNSIVLTNWGTPFGYYTNAQVLVMCNGDSIPAGVSSGDGHDVIYHLTNSFLPANFIYGTNAGVGGKTMATIDTEMNSVLAPWQPGTNYLWIIWAGVNDFAANATAETTFAHAESVYNKVKGSNGIVVAVTITSSTLLLPSQQEELRKYNQMIMCSSNWDYCAMVGQASPPPPTDGFYNGGTHYLSDKPAAYLIAKTLERGRKNLLVPLLNTPYSPGISSGSATAFTGAQSPGSDSVLLGFGATPILYQGTFGSQLFSIYPSSGGKTVEFAYNPSGNVYNGAADALMIFQRNTNVFFPKGVAIGTNSYPVVPITPAGTGGAAYTNNIGTRAMLSIPYYLQYSATGTPCGTVSNRVTGKKFIIAATAAITDLETNMFLCPPCSINDVWDIRNESTGSGATFGFPASGTPAAEWYPVN